MVKDGVWYNVIKDELITVECCKRSSIFKLIYGSLAERLYNVECYGEKYKAVEIIERDKNTIWIGEL